MESSAARALAHIASQASGGPAGPSVRVTLHFHPDRLVGQRLLLDVIADDGVYRSQFETGISNGGLTAYPGGDRWRWESSIFGGAYDDRPGAERPKYGSLNFRGRRIGGSPRFGSAYLRLAPHVLARTSFCYPDSVFAPQHFGVADRLSPLIEMAEAGDRDPLDDYVEAHVHGEVHLARDVEALVLDPCYRKTATEAAARRLGCPIEWHDGFTLPVSELRRNPSYRGPEFVKLGLSLAEDGLLTAGMIGAAARTGSYDQQALKRVWHYVARFGTHEFKI
nr:DUF3626 domain-containing protein [Phytoactinopolyspora mesophila]